MLYLRQTSVWEGNSGELTIRSLDEGIHDTGKPCNPLEYHLDCLTRVDSFKSAYEDPRSSICGQFNKELVDHIANNWLIMECIVWAIL